MSPIDSTRKAVTALILSLVGAAIVARVVVLSLGERPPARIRMVWLSDFHWLPAYTHTLGPPCRCFSYGPLLCDKRIPSALTFPYDAQACLDAASGSRWGQYGCDAPWDLVESALGAARAATPDPDAVLVTGDYTAHHACHFPVSDPAQEGLRIIHGVSRRAAEVFGPGPLHLRHAPMGSIATAVAGNGDFVPGYFLPNVTAGALAEQPLPYLESVADGLRPKLTPSQRSRFVRGGGVRYRIGQITVLALNTVIYSPAHAKATGLARGDGGDDPFGQFAWLEGELWALERRGARGLITGHILPTVDQYTFRLEWEPHHAARYARVVSRFRQTVSAQLFGHAHQNMVRAFPVGEGGVDDGPPLFVAAAVSPVYNNNPTWWSLELDARTGKVEGATAHAASLAAAGPGAPPEWRPLYTLPERYAPHDARTSAGIRALAEAMMDDEDLWRRYLFDRVSGAPGWSEPPESEAYLPGKKRPPGLPGGRAAVESGAAQPPFRAQVACSIAHGWSQEDFDACVAAGGPGRKPRPAPEAPDPPAHEDGGGTPFAVGQGGAPNA